METCMDAVYSEEYADYILETGGNIQAVQKRYAPDCMQQIDGSFVTIYEKQSNKGERSFEKYGYGAVPKCYGLLDTSSIDSTGATRLKSRPNFFLQGNGVLVGFVDAGIDYTNPLFLKEDGTTRIRYMWDQEDGEWASPEGILYGCEYSEADINRAISGEIEIPIRDQQYHGTFLAGIAAGSYLEEQDFVGMAPNAELLVVSVKQAKNSLKEFYGITTEEPCYQENDVMMAVRYIWEKSQRLGKPVVICIGMGTNSGSHTSLSPLGDMIDRFGNLSGVCIVGAAGNETNYGHHYSGQLEAGEERTVELEVLEDEAFTAELWSDAIGAISVGLVSPDGENSGRITIRSYEQRVDYIFAGSRIYVYYERIEYYSGEEVVVLRMKGLQEGIWQIRVTNIEKDPTVFHVWLPMTNFLKKTRFLSPSPDTIVCNPGNSYQMITVAAYDHTNGSIYVNSSRGYTSNSRVKPDVTAPGVNVYGPVSKLRYGRRSGTSIAAAHVAGGAALIFEWAIVNGNDVVMNTVTAKNYILRGAKRVGLEVPNKSFGWGIFDLYQAFEVLRIY